MVDGVALARPARVAARVTPLVPREAAQPNRRPKLASACVDDGARVLTLEQACIERHGEDLVWPQRVIRCAARSIDDVGEVTPLLRPVTATERAQCVPCQRRKAPLREPIALQ